MNNDRLALVIVNSALLTRGILLIGFATDNWTLALGVGLLALYVREDPR